MEPTLPPGWTARRPESADVDALVDLVRDHRRTMIGMATIDPAAVASEAVGVGSWTRRQRVIMDEAGRLVGWVRVHDRAAGRTAVDLTLADSVDDAVASALFAWLAEASIPVVRLRGLEETQLDASAYDSDDRQRRWLEAAGYTQVRTWLQMSRQVQPEEGEPGGTPAPREGVRIRHVEAHPGGLPQAEDLQTVHELLEQSFADHFNSYRESFPEFIQRLREDPGHRWDHWWIATVEIDGEPQPAGAVVSSVSPPDGSGTPGAYIDYIGVHRRARGRGVAKALLYTVIAESARRGRDRVGLEVDADSPTGADQLYTSLGWQTTYRTESWHRTLLLR